MSTVPHNPFKDLRQRRGLSQYRLASEAGITKHAILRLEQGCYEKPLPSVVSYFMQDRDPSVLLEQYVDFQYHTRLSNAGLFGADLAVSLDSCPVGTHPLVHLRSSYNINPTQLSKLLCISQSTIVYFEKSSVHQHTVPAQLIRALHDADYSELDTLALCNAYQAYRTWIKDSRQLTLVAS